MQVAKYWRNKKLRYRLEGLALKAERPMAGPKPERNADRNRRKPLKCEPMRLLQ